MLLTADHHQREDPRTVLWEGQHPVWRCPTSQHELTSRLEAVVRQRPATCICAPSGVARTGVNMGGASGQDRELLSPNTDVNRCHGSAANEFHFRKVPELAHTLAHLYNRVRAVVQWRHDGARILPAHSLQDCAVTGVVLVCLNIPCY